MRAKQAVTLLSILLKPLTVSVSFHNVHLSIFVTAAVLIRFVGQHNQRPSPAGITPITSAFKEAFNKFT